MNISSVCVYTCDHLEKVWKFHGIPARGGKKERPTQGFAAQNGGDAIGVMRTKIQKNHGINMYFVFFDKLEVSNHSDRFVCPMRENNIQERPANLSLSLLFFQTRILVV